MAKMLITGVAGFVGSNLARGLLAEGVEVRGVDNLSTGRVENLAEVRVEIDFREADILDAAAMEDACLGVDCVFHLAAVPSVPKSVADPVGTHGPNVTGTLMVLEAARKAKVRRVLYAGSSSVYGNAAELPKQETMTPAPISAYAVQKLASEHYMAAYTRMYGLETVTLRYFNVFGPRQDPGSQYSGVLSRFITQMLRSEAPTIFGDGTTSRDFTYVENVVSANLLAARAPGVAGSVFNVACGRRITLLEAQQEIARAVGYRGEVKFAAEREGDVRHSLADISRAEKILGYRVGVDFAAGLEKTIGWYREKQN